MVKQSPSLSTKLPTELMGELQFRRLAGLCEACGKAVAEFDSAFCEECGHTIGPAFSPSPIKSPIKARLCIDCGLPIAHPYFKRCFECEKWGFLHKPKWGVVA